MIKNLAQVHYTTHKIHISQDLDSQEIICFKYDDGACDFEVFLPGEDMSYWMVEPLPILTYRVITSDE